MTNKLTFRPVRFRTAWWLPALAVLLCVALGCQDTPTMITGDVTIDGQPLAIGPNMRGTVVLQPTSRQGPVLNGIIGRSGHFQLAAGSSRSIDPGVYLATVSAVEIEPAASENSLPSGKRITPAKYASSDTSGLRIEVKPGQNHVILNLESDPALSSAETSTDEIVSSSAETLTDSSVEALPPRSVQEQTLQEHVDAVEQDEQ